MQNKKIVAFLQNQWFKEPQRVKDAIARRPEETHEAFRHQFLVRALFAGCHTGKRLESAFGPVLCDEIYWEEISREMGDYASAVFPPNIEHIKAVLKAQDPGIVIAFGKHAEAALRPLAAQSHWLFLTTPHPAARFPDTIVRLKATAERVKQLVCNHAWVESRLNRSVSCARCGKQKVTISLGIRIEEIPPEVCPACQGKSLAYFKSQNSNYRLGCLRCDFTGTLMAWKRELWRDAWANAEADRINQI